MKGMEKLGGSWAVLPGWVASMPETSRAAAEVGSRWAGTLGCPGGVAAAGVSIAEATADTSRGLQPCGELQLFAATSSLPLFTFLGRLGPQGMLLGLVQWMIPAEAHLLPS